MIDTQTRIDASENFIVTQTNTVLEEKVMATIIPATVVTIHCGVSMTIEKCRIAQLRSIDEDLRNQVTEITTYTANKINMKLIEAPLITMIDQVIRKAMHGIGRAHLNMGTQAMISTMGDITMTEEQTLMVHIIMKDSMIMLDEVKRSHLRMLLEARKTTAVQGQAETMEGKWSATTVIIELTIMSKRSLLRIPTTMAIIVTTIVTAAHDATEIQGNDERRSARKSLMVAMNIQDVWRAIVVIHRDRVIRMTTVTVAEVSNNENDPNQNVKQYALFRVEIHLLMITDC